MAQDALIVVDIQNDFCPGGALAVPDGDAIVPTVNALMAASGQVILTQDWHPAGHRSFASAHPGRLPYQHITLPYGEQTLWPDHCIAGTPGADFHPALEQNKAALIVRKGRNPALDSYSAFFENDRVTTTGLCGYLREHGVRCGSGFRCGSRSMPAEALTSTVRLNAPCRSYANMALH